MFKNAIVRKPYQHSKYVQVLEADSRYPDSTFVEDVALCTPQCVIITNPGTPSRNGERLEMKEVLQSNYNILEFIEVPGTLDAELSCLSIRF